MALVVRMRVASVTASERDYGDTLDMISEGLRQRRDGAAVVTDVYLVAGEGDPCWAPGNVWLRLEGDQTATYAIGAMVDVTVAPATAAAE